MTEKNRRLRRIRRIIGVILVPLTIAGVLVWSLWSPAERLDTVAGAIVNLDEPVELDGQLLPLGRQLAAGLIGDDIDTNYDWVMTDEAGARAGLDDGTYVAVITIPTGFSAAATSFAGDAASAEKAVIDVELSERSRLIDDTISQTITAAATSVLSQQLTEQYLDNIYLSFGTLSSNLGEAADGARALADGQSSLAEGAGMLADGASQLASGAGQAASGASTFAGELRKYTDGVAGVVGGLAALKAQTAALPGTVSTLAGFTADAATGSITVAGELGAFATQLGTLATTECTAAPASALCAELSALATSAGGTATTAGQLVVDAATANGYASALSGADPAAGGGVPALVGGIAALADGAAPLGQGSAQVAAGASDLASGIRGLASGASGISGGIAGIADGATEIATGTQGLADGLAEAVDAIPAYTDAERTQLAKVVAQPVGVAGEATLGFGGAALPLYAALALWLGALATFIALRARPKRLLDSTRPSYVLALRMFALPAGVAVAQGVIVGALLALGGSLTVGAGFGFVALSVLGALAFTAVNQALLVWFGGTGRFISMVIGVIVLATGIISTVPGLLDTVHGVLPVEPLVAALRGVVNGTVAGGSIAALVLWGLGGLVATSLALSRGRTVRASTLIRSNPVVQPVTVKSYTALT